MDAWLCSRWLVESPGAARRLAAAWHASIATIYSKCMRDTKNVYNEMCYAKLSMPPIHAERASRATLSLTTRPDKVASSRDSCETWA